VAIKKKFREFIDNLGYQQKIESAKLHLKQDDESVSDFLRRSADPLKEAATVAAEKTAAVASKTQGAVNKGIHRVLGSEEYKKSALEVNARLSIALDSIEDAVRRRDEEIVRLNHRIEELQSLLNNSSENE
jgi:hypothetical protein